MKIEKEKERKKEVRKEEMREKGTKPEKDILYIGREVISETKYGWSLSEREREERREKKVREERERRKDRERKKRYTLDREIKKYKKKGTNKWYHTLGEVCVRERGRKIWRRNNTRGSKEGKKGRRYTLDKGIEKYKKREEKISDTICKKFVKEKYREGIFRKRYNYKDREHKNEKEI